MDDLSKKFAEILNNPKSLEQVRSMAESILGSSEGNSLLPEMPNDEQNSLSPEQLSGIISIVNRLKNTSDNSRTALLLALKPHLSAPRQEKVDTAVKLLKIIDALPLLKDSGLLNF